MRVITSKTGLHKTFRRRAKMKGCIKVLAVLIVVFGLVIYSTTNSPAAEPDTLKIGLMYALSGKGSSLGTMQMAAAQAAVKEINEKGGINFQGKKVKLEAVAQDDETNPDAAIRKMKAMIMSDKVVALVGGTFADVSMAENDQAKRTPVLFCWTNGVPENTFSKQNKGPYSVSPMISNESVGRGAAGYAVDKMKMKNIVALMPDYAYGHAAFQGIEEVMKKHPEVKYQVIWTPVGTADMTQYLIKARDAKPDIILMGQWGNDAIQILKQAHDMELGKNAKLFFNYMTDAFAIGIPPEAIDGVTVQMFWYHDMSGFPDKQVVDGSNKINAEYIAATGQALDPYAMAAYCGVKEVARGIELAQSTDSKKIYDALMAHPDWMSPKGPAKWQIDGAVAYKYDSFIGVGLAEKERKNKWDYLKIIDSYAGGSFMKPPSELGW
jgi:branched-chain amino acid transport system substrate-binding protein